MLEPAPIERPLPQNIDAERSILGASLLDNNALKAAIEILRPEDFFHDHHRKIFRQMIAMHAVDTPIDLVTLTDQLHRTSQLEGVGGAAYLASLIDGVPHVTNVHHYADIVKEKSLLRLGVHVTHAGEQQFLDGEDRASAIAQAAIEKLTKLQEQDTKGAVEIYTPAEIMGLSREAVEHICYGIALKGMIAALDGQPKAGGKSTMVATGIAASQSGKLFLNHATTRVPTFYVTEESPRTVRLLLERCGLANIDIDGLYILPASRSALPWAQLVLEIEKQCAALKIGWLIVDTFHGVAGLEGDAENDAGAVVQALTPLRRISAAMDIAVTVTRHTRKSGGSIGESGRGSSAFTGFVDTILELKRIPGNQFLSRRQLEITGRIEQAQHTIELCDGNYKIVHDEDPQDSVPESERLSQAISANPTASKRQLEEQTGIGRNRQEKIAAKAGWLYGESGWERGGS